MVALLTWLWSPLGRALALAGVALAFVAAVFLKGRAAGVASQRARQQRRQLEAVETRRKVDDEVARRPGAARRERLRDWARD